MTDARRNWRLLSAPTTPDPLNRILGEIADRFDQLEGYRGQGRVKVPPKSERDAVEGTELVRKSQLDAVAATIPTTSNTSSNPYTITPIGGFAIRLEAGESLAAGNVVYSRQAGGKDMAAWKAPTSADMPIGVAYEDYAAGAQAWIVVSGIAYVLPESGVTAVRGNVMTCSPSEPGRVEQFGTAPAAQHWREVGHWLENGTRAGAAARATIHFN